MDTKRGEHVWNIIARPFVRRPSSFTARHRNVALRALFTGIYSIGEALASMHELLACASLEPSGRRIPFRISGTWKCKCNVGTPWALRISPSLQRIQSVMAKSICMYTIGQANRGMS